MTKEKMVGAFNEWMRQYIEDPHSFEAEFESVRDFCRSQVTDEEPDYGRVCTELMYKLAGKI